MDIENDTNAQKRLIDRFIKKVIFLMINLKFN